MVDSSSPRALDPRDEAALRSLKARYFRAIDTQDWGLLLTVFTDDASFDGFAFEAPGPQGFVAGVSAYLAGVQSVHHGFTPEYRLVSDGIARGIWVMEDYLFWPPDSRGYKGISIPGQWGIRGFGHYEEEYLRAPDGWRISFMRLSRVRVEPLVGPGHEVPPYAIDGLGHSWLS